MYKVVKFDSLLFKDHPNDCLQFWQIWTFAHIVSITKFDIPLKVPHLLALGHIL